MQDESGIKICTCISITCIHIKNTELQMGPHIKLNSISNIYNSLKFKL